MINSIHATGLFLYPLQSAVRRCSSKYVFLKISQYSQRTPVLECFFNKVTFKKRLQHRCFSVNNFLKEHLQRLLLPSETSENYLLTKSIFALCSRKIFVTRYRVNREKKYTKKIHFDTFQEKKCRFFSTKKLLIKEHTNKTEREQLALLKSSQR